MGDRFHLRRHYPSEINYKISEEGNTKPAKLQASYNIQIGASTINPLDWRVALTVKFQGTIDDKTVAEGSITFVGFFDLPESVPEAERENFAAKHGASVLYGAARELVANLTARSPHMHILLPLISFNEVKVPPQTAKSQVRSASPNPAVS